MDEQELCLVKVGQTKEGQLAGLFHGWDPVEPGDVHTERTATSTSVSIDLSRQLPKTPGLVVADESGGFFHYFTDPQHCAVLCVHCKKKLVDQVRLKKGLWGPVTEGRRIPKNMIVSYSFRDGGTQHGIRLGSNRKKIKEKYGKPHFEEKTETGMTIRYRWATGPLPTTIEFHLENNKVTEIFLEELPLVGGIRVMDKGSPDEEKIADEPEVILRLGGGLDEKMAEGEQYLKEGKPEKALELFNQVFEILDEADPYPHFDKAFVLARWSLAAARSGRGKEAIERMKGILSYIRTYVSSDHWDALRMLFTSAEVRRSAGDTSGAVKDLVELWKILQVSPDYHFPEIKQMVHLVALKLKQLGVSEYMNEISASKNSPLGR